ncbi:MAG: VOC family protein [Peptococcaceae bacterium]|nr:VOC family protein [Peptococcaceae bacterium]MDH7524157.1 VOC family protein [Peptococcaceae bacterium]
MLKELLHIGFVVRSIDETMKSLLKLGAVELGRKAFPETGQTSALISIGNTRYELMEPLGENGVVPKYLEKHGEGFHHISFLCGNVDEECARLEREGIKVLNKTIGDGKHKFFTHPKSSGGIIYEISEQYD